MTEAQSPVEKYGSDRSTTRQGSGYVGTKPPKKPAKKKAAKKKAPVVTPTEDLANKSDYSNRVRTAEQGWLMANLEHVLRLGMRSAPAKA